MTGVPADYDIPKREASCREREDLVAGPEFFGLPLEEHITNVIGFMREQGRCARSPPA